MVRYKNTLAQRAGSPIAKRYVKPPLSETPCVTTLDIEPLMTCFSTELLFTTVLRTRPSWATDSVTRSRPFAVKDPGKGRSGDALLRLTYCRAAITTAGSVKM